MLYSSCWTKFIPSLQSFESCRKQLVKNIPTRRWMASTVLPNALSPGPPTTLRAIILGAPGSGKGTQADRLLRHYDLSQVVLGQLLRNEARLQSDLGRLALSYMKNGDLLPDDIVLKVVKPEISQLRGKNWILDGYPRTGTQAASLDAVLEAIGEPINLVINLDVPSTVILKRIEDRWIHAPSGRTYNLSFNPPIVPGRDDVTGEPLSKRPDDDAETFRKRLEGYHAENASLLDYYRRKDDVNPESPTLITLKGESSDEIWKHLRKIISIRFPQVTQTFSSNI